LEVTALSFLDVMPAGPATLIGAVIAGVIGIVASLVAVWLQNKAALAAERRAAADRAAVVRACLAAELDLVIRGIALFADWKVGDAPAAVAMATLGSIKPRMYPALIPQLGALGPKLTKEIVGLYANLELLIDQGQEIALEVSKLSQPSHFEVPPALADVENRARLWIVNLKNLHAPMAQILAHLRAE
jgi:hypothetical protein